MDSVEEVKSKLDIVDIIGEYLPLKPAGSGSFKANCPFHQEKTPSFMVNRPRQSWHCFGCNIGGDMISFIEKIEGMEFLEALELLAQKAGVTLPRFDKKQMGIKKRLQEVNEYISKLLRHTLLTDPEAEIARKYVEQRGIDDLTADLWKIGYAPRDWTKLQAKLTSEQITASELIQVGIASARESGQGIYFRFRGRLMFPILDAFGRVAGFTGRILTDEKAAKYINTPETVLYKKSHILYGLDKAKASIKQQDMAIVVEGNMDALTSHQFGVANVVASSGTALTMEQLTLLKRFTRNLTIAFDMDSAGLNATLRGLDLARQMDFAIRVIWFNQSDAKDPDDLIREDVEQWKDAIRNAKPIMDWVYAQAFEQFSDSSPEGKRNIAQFVLNECRHIPHPVERDAWITKLAADLKVSADALRSTLQQLPKPVQESQQYSGSQNQEKPVNPAPDLMQDLEAKWLALVYHQPALFHEIHYNWHSDPHAKLYNLLKQGYNSAVQNNAQTDDDITSLINYLALLFDKEFPQQTSDVLSKALLSIEQRLLDRSLNEERKKLEDAMRDAERSGDPQRIQEVLEAFNRLSINQL